MDGGAGGYGGARDQFAPLVAIRERGNDIYHPYPQVDRANLANWTGEASHLARPATSTPLCCPTSSGSPARSIQPPCRSRQPGKLDRADGRSGRSTECYATLLSVIEQVQSPEHPTFRTVQDNLAAGPRKQIAALSGAVVSRRNDWEPQLLKVIHSARIVVTETV